MFADAARLLHGWPTLGREIDERTLPQEVRFDALGGVKYDKGCYTGQETVARLHFRGHANRALRGLAWAASDRPTSVDVTHGDKVVGTIRTLARLGDRTLALAIIRREVATGELVMTGATAAEVVELPIDSMPPAVA
jgi:folate-binding protein YgfZ